MQKTLTDQIKEDYQTCLKSGFRDPSTLNRLAYFYEMASKPYVALLCRMASLLADITQKDVYQLARLSYESGTLVAEPFRFDSPCSCTISIIVATCNRADSLRSSLISILNQTFQDFEVIVINDGGSDDAREVVTSFMSPKLRYLFQQHAGQYVATNFGIKESKGEFITYLDDDDIFYSNHLETLYNAIKLRNADIIYGRNRWVIGKWMNGHWLEEKDLTKYEPYDVRRLYGSCIIANQNVLHSRNLVEKVGLYQDEPERGCDWEFRVRCSRLFEIERLAEITSEVRVPGNLPAKHPERAQFYSQLWPLYFRSAFGKLILAIAGWANEDTYYAWEHIQKIDTWQYLSKRSLDALWPYLFRLNSSKRDYLLDRLSHYQPVWLTKKLLVAPRPLFLIKPKFLNRALVGAVNSLVFKERLLRK